MREIMAPQLPLIVAPFGHAHARELAEVSEILDALPEAAAWVHADLVRHVRNPKVGRAGMSGERVLRVLLVKQMTGFSYEQLVFHLGDSVTYRAFCKLGFGEPPPTKSTLKRNLKRVRAETIERINELMLQMAKDRGVEQGRKVRFDCTVSETNIHDPSDSSLLWDCVRVLTRGMENGRQWVSVPFRDHTLRAKRRSIGIQYAKTKVDQKKLYRDLLKVTRATVESAERVVAALGECKITGPVEYARVVACTEEMKHYVGLAQKVIEQTTRRVVLGEKVAAKDKIVSIFEPHTDIIVKDRRNTFFGHKLCLATGASGLVLDFRIEDGNPADATLAVEMVRRQADIFDRVPRQVAFDGGFASKENLKAIKELGVRDVMFSKKCGLQIVDMAKSERVYKELRRFRAGVEAGISYLKRCFGLGRCTWRSLDSFKTYTWASVLAANLLTLARHALR